MGHRIRCPIPICTPSSVQYVSYTIKSLHSAITFSHPVLKPLKENDSTTLLRLCLRQEASSYEDLHKLP